MCTAVAMVMLQLTLRPFCDFVYFVVSFLALMLERDRPIFFCMSS